MDVQELHISAAQYGSTAAGDHTAWREPAWEGRQSEINGDGRKKVIAEGEPECENVSIAERKQADGGKGRTQGGAERT